MKFTTTGSALLFTFLSTAIATVFAGTAQNTINPSKDTLDKFCVLQAKGQGIPDASAGRYVWSAGKCVDSDDADLEQRCQPLIKESFRSYFASLKGSESGTYDYQAPQFHQNYGRNPQIGAKSHFPNGVHGGNKFWPWSKCDEGKDACYANCANLCHGSGGGCPGAQLGCEADCAVRCGW